MEAPRNDFARNLLRASHAWPARPVDTRPGATTQRRTASEPVPEGMLDMTTTLTAATRFARRRAPRLGALAAAAGIAASAFGQFENLGNQPQQPTQPTQPGGPDPLLNPGTVPAGSIPTQPAGQPGTQPGGPGMYTLPAFAEGVELKELVDYVVNTLKINVVVDPTLTGTVVINRAISVPRDELLPLLNGLLEQQNFMIYEEAGGWYQVVPTNPEKITVSPQTTRMISTPNMKPSSLRPAVEAVFPPSRAANNTRVVYLDDLGLIMVTDTPRTVEAVERVILQIRDKMGEQQWFRIELVNVSAPAALERAIGMVGGTDTGSMQPDPTQQFQQPGMPAAPTGARTASLITNIESRLRVDVQGNGLVFYGRPEEMEMIREIVRQIDVATRLESRTYEAGAYAEQIANLARQQGLGEVIVVEDQADENQNQFFPNFGGQFGQPTQQTAITGGSQMIVDTKRGRIIYFGTPQQHEILGRLIEEIGLEADAVTIEAYPLQNADAEETAELLRQLILGESSGGEGGLLPNSGGQSQPVFNPFTGMMQSGSPEGISLFGDEYTAIHADVPNNQVLVRAPANLQPMYERLIDGLDMRRQQVYIKAHIIAINNTDTSRLAFETQLINATGDPVFQTNFGLNQAGTGTDILDPRNPLATLTGLTTAVIRSDYVPIIINATATNIDGRIIASPQLLVNDNFEAEIIAIEQQPTTTTTQTTGNPAQTSFGGYEDAGTTLTVTPSISSNGWIRMEYEITLSSFIGQGSNGVPPPKQDNTLRAEGVTIPSDATIVVGGIELQNSRDTVVKVPLIGDIPILGHLFRDTNKNDTGTLLYVFITPYIMADPSFQDMRLLTRGPQDQVEFQDDLPRVEPRAIEIIAPAPAARMEP